MLCSALNTPIGKDSSTELTHPKRGNVIIYMTCGTVLHAYSFLTLLSRNKFVDVKRFASKIIMGRPCYCCLHFLITRADQFVDRLASTRDTYEYPEISVACEGFVGRERGSVQFSHSVLSNSLRPHGLLPLPSILSIVMHTENPRKNQNSQFEIQFLQNMCHFCTIIKLQKSWVEPN